MDWLFIALIVGSMYHAARKMRKNAFGWGFIGLILYIIPGIFLTTPIAHLLYLITNNNTGDIMAYVVTKILGILFAFAAYRVYLVPKNAAGKKKPWYMQ